MRAPILIALVLVASAAAAQKREVGNLVLDDVPDVPKRIAERQQQYLSARGATFLDWEPTGAGMLIHTRFGDVAQVHHVAQPGGDRRQLTFFAEPVTNAVYAAKRPDRGFFFRMDTGGGEAYQYYWFERATGQHTLVTDGTSRNQSFLPSRRGDRFAYASTRRNKKDFDIWVMDGFDGRTAKLVKQVEGQWAPLAWSPDDAKLLLKRYVSINESYLEILDLVSGTSTPVNAQPGKRIAYAAAAFGRGGDSVYYASDEDAEFQRLVRHDLKTGRKTVLTPDLPWDVTNLVVSDDGAFIAYVVNEGGASALYLAPLASKFAPQRITLPKGVIGNLAFDRQSKRLGFTLSTAQSPSDAFSVDVRTRKLVRWTESEVGGLNPAVFVAPELITYHSFDGKPIQAWYYRPRKEGPVPVVIAIHGGPEAQATAAFNPIVQYWVNELGVAVLQPNVRGSAGYGKSFLLLDNGDKREDSVKDIGHLLYFIADRPELDASRVAVYGGSYGGYMVLASLVHFGSRIKCGVDVVGISNFVTFLERTEAYRRDLRRAEYGDERDPAMRKHLQAISPTTNAKKIDKPLFVVQGANDPRVPAFEAEQIVKTVRSAGRRVWYMLAKDEGHGFQKKQNRDAFVNAVGLFFEEHLLK